MRLLPHLYESEMTEEMPDLFLSYLRKDNFCGSLKIDAECACCKRDECESVIRVILVQLNLLVS